MGGQEGSGRGPWSCPLRLCWFLSEVEPGVVTCPYRTALAPLLFTDWLIKVVPLLCHMTTRQRAPGGRGGAGGIPEQNPLVEP